MKFNRKRFESEMDAELRAHIDRYVDDLVASGIPREEAMRRARIEFGTVEAIKEDCRQSVGLRWSDALQRDLRYAARLLRKSPAFTAAAVLTLGLCIGANTAIFSVVDAVLLRPLPYPSPDRLAAVVRAYERPDALAYEDSQNGATWEAVRDHTTSVDTAVWSGWGTEVNLSSASRAECVRQQRVSTGYFRVLGVSPIIGREFTREEDRPNGPAVTILTEGLWHRIFNGDPSAVGRTVLLQGKPHVIVGIMGDRFENSTPADLWTPLQPSTEGEGGGENYGIIARLKPGVSWSQADSEMQLAGESSMRNYKPRAGQSIRLRIAPLQLALTTDLRQPLYILWTAVGAVLLIGCVNIASLLLARSAVRQREIATRLALGSGRGVVIRQLLVESIVLALIGGLVGVGLGYLGVQGLKALAHGSFGVWQTVAVDLRVLAVTAGVSILTSIAFGLFPAFQATRVDIRAGLGAGTTRAIAGSATRWPRRALVIAEVSLGFTLLIGAGLLIRTFVRLHQMQPGFDSSHVIAGKLSLADDRYNTAEKVNRLIDGSLARIRESSGVEAAAVSLSVPYERALNLGFQKPGSSQHHVTNLTYITPQYFDALKIPLLRGRSLTDRDRPGTSPVVIVSDNFVKRFFNGSDVLGLVIRVANEPREIVGVVGDILQTQSLNGPGPIAPMPMVYIPASQTNGEFLNMIHVWFSPSWIVRSASSRREMISSLENAVASIDPQLPFSGFRTMDQFRSKALAKERFQAVLLGSLAALALMLAAIGIYSLIANSVVERRRELGIRIALGATTGQAMRSIALPGIALAAIGIAIGYPLSQASGKLLAHVISGISTTDPLTYASAAAGLLTIAALASVIPALRVTRLNPGETLREE